MIRRGIFGASVFCVTDAGFRRSNIADDAQTSSSTLAKTPPMGWMSWLTFECRVDCSEDAGNCISEWLYRNQTKALKEGGYVQAGYDTVHIDDCWMQKGSRSARSSLEPNSSRFPSGMKALGDYMHDQGLKFGLYTCESDTTCAGYAGSANHEDGDSSRFAQWGVDYMKVDGCGSVDYYPTGYAAMGKALRTSGRDIVYSCSWPAYLGDNETTKPFDRLIGDGCHLWRNWADVGPSWGSVASIIEHWGEYGPILAPYAGPGHWHDMDMLLIGGGWLTLDEERTQMAIWSICASPLIMGNDLRKVGEESKAILLNEHAIGINQDPKGQMGLRLHGGRGSRQEVWTRNLSNGDVAVALFNKRGAGQGSVLEVISDTPCPSWHQLKDARVDACSGGAGSFLARQGVNPQDLSHDEAVQICCADPLCDGFLSQGSPNTRIKYNGMDHSCARSRDGEPADITIEFADVGLHGVVSIFDVWRGKPLGDFEKSYTAESVPLHASAFLRLSSVIDPAFTQVP